MHSAPHSALQRGYLFALSIMGLRQRIMAILVAMALVSASVVAVSLHLQSALLSQSSKDVEFERRQDSVRDAAIVLLQTANTFSSMGLNLNGDEGRRVIARGDKVLSQFEALHAVARPFLNATLPAQERTLLNNAVSQIRRSWSEISDGFGQMDYEEIAFHLMSVMKYTEIAKRLILKAEEISHKEISSARDSLVRNAEAAKRTVLVFLFGGFALLLSLGWFLLHFGVKRPLSEAATAVGRIADGDLTSPVPKASNSDEIGAILSALEIFRDNAQARRTLAEDRARDMIERDRRRENLEATIAEFRAAAVAALGESDAAMQAMSLAAQELIKAAADTQAEANRVNDASHEVSTNVAGVAAATLQLSGSVESIGRSVKQAEVAIDQAAQRANVTSMSIGELSQAAQTIGDVVSFIDSIASQTNLLALNATIEAARAGAAGRGFAVVAAEVKTLATQTAAATENITRRIDEMRLRTAEAVKGIGGIVNSSGEAANHASIIATAVDSQNQATALFTKNLQDAAGWTADLSEIVEGLTGTVVRTKAAAERMQTASLTSSAAAGKFDGLVDGFLARVRAA